MYRHANTLFPDFEDRRIETAQAELAVLTGGSGPAVLLLHGYPETRSAWHRIAPVLATHYSVVIPDLPGYGDSHLVADTEGAGSKRRMAKCLHEMMKALGHERFAVVGHDRGGRVAYRMALDYPEAVTALVSVTVVPTPEMWEGASKTFGMGAWHWFMMAQPAPLPEKLMAADPRFLIDLTLDKMALGIDRLHPLALEDYRAAFDREEVRHAMCEDYRAGATIDDADDLIDRASGRKIQAPVLVLSEAGRLYGGGREPLNIWADWAENVEDIGIGGGHLLPETAAEEVLGALLPFLEKIAR
ncbi:alpha/beta hydrolase [Agrobacterium sp. SHOUNA12C]|uniref:AB hydrolase-1 domain-containing protein n=1 Tax=Rhizobium rhizogenes NBRC 13257 TaxID=1220581 RepID=A0AA87QA06_RHIRH|nr:alpha/beta hydrolase [Rhizobium rhizogenes]MCJ9721351.1 alpha/beta hydrolase [Agrobacterium sp. BETTINA12B]MCJ9757429.1 alpha/beta hydrolase [Agrobacterium sp. SHOUNA12C]NTF57169.1 alpha/beta hydrolase [Rhizobium rhizogenes]NTF64030.1 alpha/beta hydrolase [Rhizobium rhizogenes]NTF76751.1 alpha/beta hydrolase [Rhizobium rhizogenes]